MPSRIVVLPAELATNPKNQEVAYVVSNIKTVRRIDNDGSFHSEIDMGDPRTVFCRIPFDELCKQLAWALSENNTQEIFRLHL